MIFDQETFIKFCGAIESMKTRSMRTAQVEVREENGPIRICVIIPEEDLKNFMEDFRMLLDFASGIIHAAEKSCVSASTELN